MVQAVYVHPLMAARDFGLWLEERMGALGISQADLARASGVNEGSLSRYKRGAVTPDPATIQKLATPLQADVEEMMRLAGHSTDEPSDSDGRTIVIKTENPDIVELVRTVEEFDSDEFEAALRVLRALYPRRKK